MYSGVDNYFITLDEPHRSCLLYLRNFILQFSDKITEERKNNTPFYYVNGKWFAHISYHPKTKEIHVSFVDGNKIEHPKLVSEGRKKMKIFYIDPSVDIDIKSLNTIMKMAISLK
jgi:hypothetical protein